MEICLNNLIVPDSSKSKRMMCSALEFNLSEKSKYVSLGENESLLLPSCSVQNESLF